jgi:CheY-like chemotaxis protein
MNKHRILVVENELIVARDVAIQLKMLGYEPLGPATTGEQALEMAKQLHPQLVLMDIHLASFMDGIDAAQAIRTLWGIPCVFMSVFFGNAEQLARAKLAEPSGLLEKPFQEFELRDVIAAAFKGH